MGKEDLKNAMSESTETMDLSQFLTTLFDQDLYDIVSDYDYRYNGHLI